MILWLWKTASQLLAICFILYYHHGRIVCINSTLKDWLHLTSILWTPLVCSLLWTHYLLKTCLQWAIIMDFGHLNVFWNAKVIILLMCLGLVLFSITLSDIKLQRQSQTLLPNPSNQYYAITDIWSITSFVGAFVPWKYNVTLITFI